MEGAREHITFRIVSDESVWHADAPEGAYTLRCTAAT